MADTEDEAAAVAARINAQLATSGRTPFSFKPVSVPELRRRFLNYHEQVSRSSLAAIGRYRTAPLHLENFARETGQLERAHEIDAEQFVRWLRTVRVAPNGHPNSRKRRLRDKGLRYVLEVSRSLYSCCARQRHLPPYADIPFSSLRIERMRVEDARPVFVFDAGSELRFRQQADPWTFAVHFTLARTGLRPGEPGHLLIDFSQTALQRTLNQRIGHSERDSGRAPVQRSADLVHCQAIHPPSRHDAAWIHNLFYSAR